MKKSTDEKIALAQDPNTPAEALRELAKDKDWNVRYYTAGNSNTPAEALRELAKDKDANVRWYTASNSNTPAEVLRDLAKDKDANVRYSTARNSNTPAEVLRDLAKDENADVRNAIGQRIDFYLAIDIIKGNSSNKLLCSMLEDKIIKQGIIEFCISFFEGREGFDPRKFRSNS